MGYMSEIDGWLEALLIDFSEDRIGLPELKRAIREKLLESYRNGQAAGQPPAPRARERRRPAPPRRGPR
jgi:hypothetical protein